MALRSQRCGQFSCTPGERVTMCSCISVGPSSAVATGPSAVSTVVPASWRSATIHRSAQAFVFAQTLDGLELQQRFPVLRPAEIPLDADEVIEADHLRRTATDGHGLDVWQQVLVRPEWLQVAEEIQRPLAVDLERVVLAQRERLRVQAELELRWSAAQGQVQSPERRRQALEVVGGAPVAEVHVIRHAGAAHERLGLSANDDELHAVLGQHRAKALKRALLDRLVQSPAPSAQPAVRARPGARALSA